MSVDLSKVDVMDLLEFLDLKNMRPASGGREVSYSCPGAEHSHGDDRPSAFMNTETTAFFCHGCKMAGRDCISLVMYVKSITQPAAERILRERYGIQFRDTESILDELDAMLMPKVEPDSPLRPATSWLSSIRGDWDIDPADVNLRPENYEAYQRYAIWRGFEPATLEAWDIGYDYVGDYLTIPAIQVDGELWGAKGRALDPRRMPKYMILGDRDRPRYGFEPYESSEIVVGLNRNRDHKTVVICEGELNAVALSQMGVERPVAIGMSYFSKRHAELVIREADEAILYFDHGDAGDICVYGKVAANGHYRPGAMALLEPFINVRVVQPPTPDDPASLLQDKRSDEALRLIAEAKTSLALTIPSV